MKVALAVMLVAVLASVPAWACRTDEECPAGQRCVFARSVEKGGCLGSVQTPSEPGEKHRFGAFLRDGGASGSPCQFNSDCRPTYACYKLPGRFEGVCGRR